jgi:hypothetical protein
MPAMTTIATEHLHRMLMPLEQRPAMQPPLASELRYVLQGASGHVDGGGDSDVFQMALGGDASRVLMVRPRTVTTLMLVDEPWYAVGLALILTGSQLWSKSRNGWGLVMVLAGVEDFVDAYDASIVRARRRAEVVVDAGAEAGVESAPASERIPTPLGVGPSWGMMVPTRASTVLVRVDEPRYAVGLALILIGGALWTKARNGWGLVMVVAGMRHLLAAYEDAAQRAASSAVRVGDGDLAGTRFTAGGRQHERGPRRIEAAKLLDAGKVRRAAPARYPDVPPARDAAVGDQDGRERHRPDAGHRLDAGRRVDGERHRVEHVDLRRPRLDAGRPLAASTTRETNLPRRPRAPPPRRRPPPRPSDAPGLTGLPGLSAGGARVPGVPGRGSCGGHLGHRRTLTPRGRRPVGSSGGPVGVQSPRGDWRGLGGTGKRPDFRQASPSSRVGSAGAQSAGLHVVGSCALISLRPWPRDAGVTRSSGAPANAPAPASRDAWAPLAAPGRVSTRRPSCAP